MNIGAGGKGEKERIILETKRLYLREMKQSDFKSLCKILQDKETMAAYEGAIAGQTDSPVSKMELWLMGSHSERNG